MAIDIARDSTPAEPDDGANPTTPWPIFLTDSVYGLRFKLPVAFGLCVFSGVLLLLAFPPFDIWPLAPLAIAIFALSVHRRRIRAGFGLGFSFGLAFFLPLLSWTSTQVGEFPWIALSTLQALYLALGGAVFAGLSRFVDSHRGWWPWVVGLVWLGQEALRDRTPFGGFPWGRVGFSQSESPLAGFAWLAGVPAVTFVTAVIGGAVGLVVWHAAGRTVLKSRVVVRSVVIVAVAMLGALLMPLQLTAPANGDGESVVVAVIQGSVPRLGLDFNAQRRAVLDNHANATIELADQVAAGTQPQPDFVVWPENAADIDPLTNTDAATVIDEAARAIKAPIILGTIQVSQKPGGQNRNVSLVWEYQKGATFQYAKQHPVPFAEYVPMKGFVRTVAGWIDERMVEGIDRVNGFQPGAEPGVIPVNDHIVSGIICFEVAYDDLVNTSVDEGSQLVVVQTNNATFNNAEATQQLAMVRLRAIEHGRNGLMASTVGVSAFVDAWGNVYDETNFDEQAVIVRELQLSETTTPATVVKSIPELIGCLTALVVLTWAVKHRWATRNRRPSIEAP